MIDVFISYRHNSGKEFASFLNYRLTDMGYNVFLDEKTLYENSADGKFPPKIENAIEECTFFLLLLAPGDLEKSVKNGEKDWLVRESKKAIDLGKVIVPVMIKEGFEFPEDCNDEPTVKELSEMKICNLSGTNANELIEELLIPKFMKDHPAQKLTEKYNKGIITPEYIKWELETLKGLSH